MGGVTCRRQTKKVPSDLKPSLIRRRHARYESRILERRALRLSAPRKPFSPASGLTPQSTPQRLPKRDRSLVTAFCSPATIGPFQGLHSRIDAPGLLLRFFARSVPLPVRPFGSTTSIPVRPGRRPLLRVWPVAVSPAGFPAAFPASTPLRDFYSHADQSVQLDSPPCGPPAEPARSPFAPRSHAYF